MKNFNSEKTFLIFIAILIALSIVSCSSKSGEKQIDGQRVVRIKNVATGMYGFGTLSPDIAKYYAANDTVWMSNSTKIIVNQTAWNKNTPSELFSLVVIQKNP